METDQFVPDFETLGEAEAGPAELEAATPPEPASALQELPEPTTTLEQPADEAIVRLVNEVKEAVQARDEWQDKYLRAAADFANARRRAELRAENEIQAARERLLTSVLPALDDFERAFNALPEEAKQSPWVEGFALIQRKLSSVLEREGVSEIAAAGQHFDPALHQAVMTEPAENVEPGTILQVLQKGYQLGDRVLRPSMVKVAQ